MNDYTFGNFLYELRTEKGLSQSQLGDMMGVSNKAVSKWEMGISKPRPAMLVMLASFFGVTVEELLAGRRNAETENQENEERDDTALKIWAGEYRKKRKRGLNAVITAILLPVLLLVYVGVIVETNLSHLIVFPIGIMAIFFAEAIDIALIFVFYGSAQRLKRILYATYPDQAEQIRALISPKRERVPMSRREQICSIICYCIMFVCNILINTAIRIESDVWGAIGLLALLFGFVAFIFEMVALLHYAIRCIRKK